uniref:Secreted protein n=1 Tax=Pseudodiaptomus poplesia TaxID=213370 RepID=A0A0U2TKQ4_9MAXI|nr:hypothetical protein [Pseudodiaptomus poplesia]
MTGFLLVLLVGCAVAKHYIIETKGNGKGSGGTGDVIHADPTVNDVTGDSPPHTRGGKNGRDYNALPQWGVSRR